MVVVVLAGIGIAAVVVGCPVFRIELDRLVVIGNDLIKLLLDVVFDAAIGIERDSVRLNFFLAYFLDSITRVQAAIAALPEAVLQISRSSAAAGL